MEKKIKLINSVLILFTLMVLLFTSIFLIIQIKTFNSRFREESDLIQSEYTESQKALVKRETEWVYDYIYANLNALEDLARDRVKKRAYEAYEIAHNIYRSNRDRRSSEEVKDIIREALRPIRYAGGIGYYFINDFNGHMILLADKPEQEGENLLDRLDPDGRTVIRDFIDIVRRDKEGHYEYLWTKPGVGGNDHLKVSFVKHFEPYNWVIGTGLYIEDEERALKSRLLKDISGIRFGEEGYIFVNTLDGDALVSNGELISGQRKLWEVFDGNPGKTKDLFRKEYEAAIKPEGDFIYYTIRKLTDAESESPKVSYILGIPEFNWLIGAGVYLDDVEEEILKLREISYRELRRDIYETVVITLLILSMFTLFIILMGRQLKRDFSFFSEFFENAGTEDIHISEQNLRFRELTELARKANEMQMEKIQALRNLKESESRFRLLAENSKDMIFKISFPGRTFDYISPASLDITGFTPRELMDNPDLIVQSVHPDWRIWFKEKMTEIEKGAVDDSFEYQMIAGNGEERWVTQKNTLILDDQGNAVALTGRLSDDTRRKKIEEELKRSYRMEAVGKLAGGVAHDFNNVLSGIMNAANVLKSPKRQIDEKGLKMADLILTAASRAADLTAKLSAFSGKRVLILKPQDVHHIIEETQLILRRTIDRKIDIQLELGAENACIIGDGTEIQSIILNLGINASHAISGAGVIVISTENRDLGKEDCLNAPFECSPGRYIRIVLRDSGSGMDEETRSRIFEPFFTTKGQGKGTGLGLATVYRSVLEHRGMIDVASTPGEGTSFSILLPCTDSIPEEPPADEQSEETGSGSILLVDDEEFIREAGMHMLEDLGYEVRTAIDGREAVSLFSEHSDEIDLVILDIIMPEMNGYEALRRIREIKADCPVIIISGRREDRDLKTLKEDETVSFLRKPFDERELNREIIKVLRRRKGEPS